MFTLTRYWYTYCTKHLCLINIMTVYPAYQDDPVRQVEGAVPHQSPQTRQAAGADSEDRGSCRQVPGDVRGI